MRIISEQELKAILDKHNKYLKGEEGGERANLRYANLRYANLRSANLSYADLSYADLSYANLRSANLSYADLSYANLRSANLSYANLVLFQFQRHQAFYTLDGTLRIGCQVMPITEWSLGFEEIGKAYEYTPEQIKAYGGFIKICMDMFEGDAK